MVGYATRWYHEAIKDLNCDHVYIWYSAFHFDSTIRFYAQKDALEFYVTNDLGEHDVLNVHTKESGICLIFDSAELQNLLRGLELDFRSKWQLGSDLGVELGLELPLELESQQGAT